MKTRSKLLTIHGGHTGWHHGELHPQQPVKPLSDADLSTNEINARKNAAYNLSAVPEIESEPEIPADEEIKNRKYPDDDMPQPLLPTGYGRND